MSVNLSKIGRIGRGIWIPAAYEIDRPGNITTIWRAMMAKGSVRRIGIGEESVIGERAESAVVNGSIDQSNSGDEVVDIFDIISVRILVEEGDVVLAG